MYFMFYDVIFLSEEHRVAQIDIIIGISHNLQFDVITLICQLII